MSQRKIRTRQDNAYDANRKGITTARFSCCYKSAHSNFLLANALEITSVHATMKGNIRMKNQHITLTIVIVALTYFAFLAPKAFAGSPPPDGCYPGFHDGGRMQRAESPHQRGWKYRSWLVCAVWN